MTPESMTHFHARAIAGTRIPWGQLPSIWNNGGLTSALAAQIEDLDMCERVLMTKHGSDSNRVMTADLLKNTMSITAKITLRRNKDDAADAVWLAPQEAFIDFLNGGILYMACTDEHLLVGRYTSHAAMLIRTAFRERKVSTNEVRISGLFCIPREGRETTFEKFRRECLNVGFKDVEELCPLPPHELFPHGNHKDPEFRKRHALAICLRII